MPGLGGPEMIRKVRETHADMKVVYISGYTEDSFRKRRDVAKDIHFLPKPFTLHQLATKVQEIMTLEMRPKFIWAAIFVIAVIFSTSPTFLVADNSDAWENPMMRTAAAKFRLRNGIAGPGMATT